MSAFDDEVGYDELGYDEVGEDLFEEVGAPARGPVRRGGAAARPQGGAVQRRQMGSDEWLGFVGIGTAVALGAASAPVACNVSVTADFTLRQMIIDRVQAASVTVGDFKIGQTSVAGSAITSPVPGDIFAPDSLANPVFRNLPKVSPAIGFTVYLGNSGTAIAAAKVGFIGVCKQAS